MFDFNKIGMRPRSSSGYKAAVTDDQIAELEHYCGHALPDNYKLMLQNFNGGEPEAKCLRVVDQKTGIPLKHELLDFFIVDEHKELPLNIWWTIENYSEFIGSNTLPFAEGEYSCIYFLKWKHDLAQVWCLKFDEDEEEEPEIFLIFNSFDELLGALYNAE